jgi:hypothetical protein
MAKDGVFVNENQRKTAIGVNPKDQNSFQPVDTTPHFFIDNQSAVCLNLMNHSLPNTKNRATRSPGRFVYVISG